MKSFSGISSQLEDKIAYELKVMDYFRSTLFSQTEAPEGGMEVTLGEVGENGKLLRNISSTYVVSASAGPIRTALSRFRPLAFITTFKIHDMIVDWILEDNGITNAGRFIEKKKHYKRLRREGKLIEPPFLRNRSDFK